MSEDNGRTASLQLDNKEHPTFVRVTVPPKITEPQLATLINDRIVNDIVFRHTGCTCLSGRINVLIESEFQEAIKVELGAARAS